MKEMIQRLFLLVALVSAGAVVISAVAGVIFGSSAKMGSVMTPPKKK